MRRYLAVLATLCAFGSLGTGTALADKGGVPNDNACHGQFVKWGNQNFEPIGQYAKDHGVNTGDFNKYIKSTICG